MCERRKFWTQKLGNSPSGSAPEVDNLLDICTYHSFFFLDNSGSTASGGFDNITVIPMYDILEALDGTLKNRVEDCKLPEEKLRLEEAIGSGSFGVVYRGQLKNEKGFLVVAVKTLKGE